MSNYLTFASAEPFTIAVNNATKNWDGVLEYSTDTASWNEWDGTTAIASAEHDGEQKIYMRGSGNSVITDTNIMGNSYDRRWILDGSNIRCTGNIENLLDYETVANGEHPAMDYYCFASMFKDCASLTKAPELPATTLIGSCYYAMFANCTSLVEAPALPATTLDACCYETMFSNCSGLTKAPELPATILADRCYYHMFYNCVNLSTIPSLPATEMPSQCYGHMFNGCPLIKLSETQTDEYPYEYRIPTIGTGTAFNISSVGSMFSHTGGTFTGTPSINTTYYTANKVIPATQPVAPKLDPTSLLMGWQVGNRIRCGA